MPFAIMVNIGNSNFTQQGGNPNFLPGNPNFLPNKLNNAAGGEGSSGPEYQGQDAQDSGIDGKNDDQARRVPYTMHGVLHYVQHEWSRYEMERAQWEMERAELQARISFLQGERKGQENLKADLVRRIKMLEYSLKQERAKNYRLTHNGQEPDAEQNSEEAELDNQVPLEVDAYSPQCNSAASFREARALLRQYLQEIGYSETILDVRSFRAKNLLGLIPQGDWTGSDGNSDSRRAATKALQETDRAVMEAAEYLKKGDGPIHTGTDDSDSDDDERIRRGRIRKEGLDPETVDALGEFSFLKDEKTSGKKHTGDEWIVNQNAIDQMKEKFRSEQERKRSSSQSESSPGKNTLHQMFRMGHEDAKRDVPPDEVHQLFGSRKGNNEFMDIDAALGIADEVNVDIKDDFTAPDEEQTGIRWNLKFTLRSHFDCIRVMQFHPVEPVLVTASEDGTAKLWNLGAGHAKSDAAKGAQVPSPSAAVIELEPTYTFRGHDGPILAMDMSPTGDMCYTGGFDGVICCWSVPSVNTDIYETYDPKVLTERLKGHTDAIWSVAYHSSDNRLVSASSDGTIRLWEPGSADTLVKTYGPPSSDLRPTSVDFVSTEPQQLLAAYTGSHASILDLETGRSVLSFDFGDDDVGKITKILSHPTMPTTITASTDRKIRYFDNNTGKLIHGTVAHVEAISSLAIDPNGLYLLSGSHDGSLRLWNMEKRVCLQEIAAHRKKFDSAVMSVAFHPSRPLIGSAGADGLAKVFASQKYSYTSSSES